MPDETPDPWAEGKRKGIYHKDAPNTAPTVTGEVKEKHGSTAGKDLGSKGGDGGGMPKQSDYPTTAAWSEALRKWRAEKAAGQSKALKK